MFKKGLASCSGNATFLISNPEFTLIAGKKRTMKELSVEELELSSEAVEALFRLYIRQWSLAVGRVNFAKTIGVSTSRLGRALAGATPAFDLAYRIHETCAVSWPAIFTGAQATIMTLKSVAKAEKERDISLDGKSVALSEARARARIRDIVEEFGFMECSRRTGIAPASLHYYLNTTRLSMSLIWRLHLLTYVPYSDLLSGGEEKIEKLLREETGKETETTGRFDDVAEPIVRLVKRYVYNEMSEAAQPFVHYVEKLLKRKLSLPQKIRVRRILTLYYDDMGNKRSASVLVRQSWADLKKADVKPTILLGHLTVTGHAGMLEHAEEVASYIMKRTDDPRIISQVYRVQSEIALENLEVYRAALLARKAAHITLNAAPVHRPFVLAQLENVLAICAWAFGDYNEALARTERLLASRVTPFHVRRVASELEVNMRIWQRDIPRVARALKSLGNCSVSVLNTEAFSIKMLIYRLRYLLLKKNSGSELSAAEEKKLSSLLTQVPDTADEKKLDSEGRLAFIVCMYNASKDRQYLKNFIKVLASEKFPAGGTPLFALPDFVEAVREAGLWNRKLQLWQERAMEKGVMNFNMRRPSE
jgi:hypothetical protein